MSNNGNCYNHCCSMHYDVTNLVKINLIYLFMIIMNILSDFWLIKREFTYE